MPRHRGGRWPTSPSRYRWVVDGHNAVFAHPELARLQTSGQRAEARRRLVQILDRFAVEYAADVVVVFDSGGGAGGAAPATGGGGIVLYSGAGEEADDRIVRLVERMRRDRDMVAVVSSDRSTLGARLPGDVVRVDPRELFRRLQARSRGGGKGGGPGSGDDERREQRPAGDFRDIEDHFRSIDEEARRRSDETRGPEDRRP